MWVQIPLSFFYFSEYSAVGSVSVLGIEGHVFKSHYSDFKILLIMELLHSFLVSLLLISSIFVIFAENPVHSVLFLILSFFNVSCILLLFQVEFLSLLFLIIYVGAIAVLFLFVIMMLNVKVQSSNDLSFIAPLIFFGIILSTQVFFNVKNLFFEPKNILNYEIIFDSLSNIDIFGQTLYNNFLVCFLIAGLILLVAMVGAIVLTLNFKSHRKGEIFSRQLSRSDNFLSFFK